MKFFAINMLILCLFLFQSCDRESSRLIHTIVAQKENRFHGWPANNGVWSWGDEILVGFTQVEYAETSGHNIKSDSPQLSLLARSTDGGQTWKMFDPDNYVGDPAEKTLLSEPVNFKHDGFAMRVFGDKYHGTFDPEAGFYYSYNKGHMWKGPYYLGQIAQHPEFEGKILTPRTDYVVLNQKECLIFISARIPDTGMSDKIACIKTEDGGLSFQFVSWVVPLSDPHRAVMPQTVKISNDEYILVARRRVVDNRDSCWIDAYRSADHGQSWHFVSKVAVTGAHNGNPPAMVRLNDGRLCCIYGNRTKRKILGRFSTDNGQTWQEEFVIRDNFYTGEQGQDMKDLGYPRLVQRADGYLVAMYYWASEQNPQQHIAASIWRP